MNIYGRIKAKQAVLVRQHLSCLNMQEGIQLERDAVHLIFHANTLAIHAVKTRAILDLDAIADEQKLGVQWEQPSL